MIASMFTLDQRLAELRPSDDELRVARELGDADGATARPARSISETVRGWLGGEAPSRSSRSTAGRVATN